MDNKNNGIKEANRKAMPKFLLIIAISLVSGGVFGYCAVEFGFDQTANGLKAAGTFFGINIAPWLMLALAVIVPFICVPLYRKTKKLLAAWDGEDECKSDAIDTKLSHIIWFSSTVLVVSYFLITAAYSGGFSMFDNPKNTVSLIAAVIGFFAIMIETILIQQKCVDAAKKTNPEKTASVYDIKFQKKWMDSCDEAEKLIIGKCAFKAYNATNIVCAISSVLLAVSALTFNIGFLPSFVVCVIWIINQSVYCRETVKYSKAGNKIS